MCDRLLRRAVVQLVHLPMQSWARRVRLDLPVKLGHDHPEILRVVIHMVSPHLADHVPLPADHAGVTDKGREQLVLGGAGVGFLASDKHKPFYEIHRQIPDRKTA